MCRRHHAESKMSSAKPYLEHPSYRTTYPLARSDDLDPDGNIAVYPPDKMRMRHAPPPRRIDARTTFSGAATEVRRHESSLRSEDNRYLNLGSGCNRCWMLGHCIRALTGSPNSPTIPPAMRAGARFSHQHALHPSCTRDILISSK